ncbi:MAG: hypothetical protein EOP56_00965 [Sphingobacteriales bacterium]|nr:MAG: hypothetical protein EOP56_00965 [Sphingobacteriales bacterium]
MVSKTLLSLSLTTAFLLNTGCKNDGSKTDDSTNFDKAFLEKYARYNEINDKVVFDKKQAIFDKTSAIILRDSGQAYIDSYTKSPLPIYSSTRPDSELTSWLVDVNQLQSLVKETIDSGGNNIQIFLARKSTQKRFLTLVLAGSREDGKHVFLPYGGKYAGVLEHCDPCPVCPKSDGLSMPNITTSQAAK